MEPVFLDLHIHTSNNQDYNLELLKAKILGLTNNSKHLISFTDHNYINTGIYLKAKEVFENLIVGVELHIKYTDSSPFYHCHAYFKEVLNEESLDRLNVILDDLYPKKDPTKSDSVPTIERIIRGFDGFDFMLLPHGGQSHSTFDDAIPTDEGFKFDDALAKSLYYNQFVGFTARGVNGLEKTQSYFKKLNINEFVNLMTCTDNYNPQVYPKCKASDESSQFIPTWMFSSPTFDGLRLALSEDSRLRYSEVKPVFTHNHIESVSLLNENIDISVELSPGLNVVIGESSSGKTLFVDSLHRKLSDSFEGSAYLDFGVTDLIVSNPSGIKPHYLSQNYIASILNAAEGDIDKIEIVKDVFPGDKEIKVSIERGLQNLRSDLSDLMSTVKEIARISKSLRHLPELQSLIVTSTVEDNILESLVPNQGEVDPIELLIGEYDKYLEDLKSIETWIQANPLISNGKESFDSIRKILSQALRYSTIDKAIRKVITTAHEEYENELLAEQRSDRGKLSDFKKLLESISSYIINYRNFKDILKRISEYSTSCKTQWVESDGHKLFIKNDFVLNKEKVKEVFNGLLKANKRFSDLDQLEPEILFEENYSERPLVNGYDDFERRVNSKFESFNCKRYQITTKQGHDFEQLSPGWKTSIILDIILSYREDMAPIIIDQPEDNLATSYINWGLVKAIKNIKESKQIILVSHNATIPMMGDAQKVVICENESGKIRIRSGRLEDEVDNKSMVSHIADLTDGGKPSIQKRVKKYYFKSFKS
jgi:predicted ATP-dependent endonuclease of OLD family